VEDPMHRFIPIEKQIDLLTRELTDNFEARESTYIASADGLQGCYRYATADTAELPG
jgi:hypothetical protein